MHPSISNISHQVVPTSLAFKQTSTVQTCTKLSNELPGQIGPIVMELVAHSWICTQHAGIRSSLRTGAFHSFHVTCFSSQEMYPDLLFFQKFAPSFSRERPKSHVQNKHKGFNKLQPNPGSFTRSQEISFCYFSLAGRFRDCQALQA